MLNFFDLNTSNKIFSYSGPENTYLRFEHLHMIDENLCLTSSTDCLIRQWDLRTPTCTKVYDVGHTDTIYCMKVDDPSMSMASCSITSLNVVDLKMQATRTQFKGDDYAITSLDFLPEKEIIVTGSNTVSNHRGIYLWHYDQPTPTRLDCNENEHPGSIWRMYCDTQKIISGSRDGSIKVWDFKEGSLICSEAFAASAVSEVIVTEDQLISSSALGEILVMDFSPQRDGKSSSNCVVQ